MRQNSSLSKHLNQNAHGYQSQINLKKIVPIIAGFGVSIFLLIPWFFISLKIHITWLPVIISLAIATTIKFTSQSTNFLYGIYSLLLSLCIAVIGNVFTIIVLYSKYSNQNLSKILLQLNFSFITSLLKTYTRPIDLFMYVGVIFGGFWFSYFHKNNH